MQGGTGLGREAVDDVAPSNERTVDEQATRFYRVHACKQKPISVALSPTLPLPPTHTLFQPNLRHKDFGTAAFTAS